LHQPLAVGSVANVGLTNFGADVLGVFPRGLDAVTRGLFRRLAIARLVERQVEACLRQFQRDAASDSSRRACYQCHWVHASLESMRFKSRLKCDSNP